MALFKFNKPYQDYELDKEVAAGEEVEMTIKRADEVVKGIKVQAEKNIALEDYKDFAYTRLDEPEKKEKEDKKDKE